jgi:tetratricopeptide (TPR) repeat protein
MREAIEVRTRRDYYRLLGTLLLLQLWPGATSAQTPRWETYITDGVNAYKQGRYAEAEQWLREAVKEAEAVKPQALRLARSLNDLGVIYYAQDKHAEAVPLYERALAIQEKILGREHPLVALTLYNLAALYHAQGKYYKAEPLYERSLAIREKTLGPEHPDVMTSLSGLAAVYHRRGKDAEAAEAEARVKAIAAKHSRVVPAK